MASANTTMDQVTPDRIFATISAHSVTQALKAGIDLDLFTVIAEGNTRVPAIAQACKASERGIRILCDHLTATGFLNKNGDEYALAPDTALFLNRKLPSYIGGVTVFLNSPMIMESFQNLSEAVKKGGTLHSGDGSMDPEHPMWVDFARAMIPMMYPAGLQMAEIAGSSGACKVLDIAAGHGIFGILIAQRNPEARITALDWKPVLEVAKEHAAQFGVADRFETKVGSAFEVDFGTGYDLILFTNFFHHFDQATCEVLMRKAHAALNEGGRVMTLEFIPNADRVSPPPAAMFALTMLATTPHGDAYTFAEYDQMFRNAGYSRSEHIPLHSSANSLVVSYK